jgi:hypothetical protein
MQIFSQKTPVAQCQKKTKMTKRLTDVSMNIIISTKSIILKIDKTLKEILHQ